MNLKSSRAFAAIALVGLAAMGSAQARDVYWSVGVNAAPGVAVGFGNAPVYVAPQPVYYAAPPVYYAPAPVYYAPRPVVLAPVPVYGGYYYGGHHKRRHHHRH